MTLRRLLGAVLAVLAAEALVVVVAGAAPRHRPRACHPARRCHHARRHRTAATTPTQPAAPPAPAPAPPPAPPTPTVPSSPAPQPPAPSTSSVQVSAREFSLTLSHPAIAAGAAQIEFLNRGQDPHDLHIRPAAGGADVFAFPLAQSGGRTDLAVSLPPGSYVFYCSIPGHEQLGMHATLVVQ